MEGKTVMLTYMQRGVGLVALLSMNLVGSDGDAPYFQADGQPKVYVMAGVSQHLGFEWTREGDTLTVKSLADQTHVPFQQLEIRCPRIVICGLNQIVSHGVTLQRAEPDGLLVRIPVQNLEKGSILSLGNVQVFHFAPNGGVCTDNQPTH